MAKRFKLRVSRILRSCRSKDPSSLPSNPVPSFLQQPPNPNLLPFHPRATSVPPKPHYSSLRRHVSSAFTCGFGSRRYLSDDDAPPKFEWEKEDNYWHVVAAAADDNPRRKIYNSSASDNDAHHDDVVSALPKKKKKKKRGARKKKTAARPRTSASSADDSGVAFSDEFSGEETETLVSSSRSFSTDSAEFSPRLKTIREAPPRRSKKVLTKKPKRCDLKAAEEGETVAARLSVFQRLIPCTVDGKVRESFAVVKRSEDPYEDFKRSMTEMIVEKQMFDEKELEQLLHCFLSLNCRDHHGLIVEAFAEIWESMFCSTTASGSGSGRRRSTSSSTTRLRVSRLV